MNNDIDIRLLDLYIEGKISADQVLCSDGGIPNAAELEKAIHDYQELIIQLEAIGFESELKKAHDGFSSKGRIIPWQRIVAIAATFILIAVLSFLVWQSKQEPELEDYFTHFDQLVTFRGEEEPFYQRAIEKYSLHKYEEAFQLFEAIPADSLNNELKFYAGVSALGSQNFVDAIHYFVTIGVEPSNMYYEQTRWYLALSYWQNGESDKALKTLHMIEKGQFKYKEAQELTTKLS